MSRDIKRVPIDFDWPTDKVWQGYLMPAKFDEDKCMDCFCTGSTPARQWIGRIGLMLDQLVEDIDTQDQGKPMHPWLAEDTYPPTYTEHNYELRQVTRHEVIRPSEDIIEFAQELVKDDRYEHNRTVRRGFMSQNRYAFTEGLIRRAGLPEKWGWCKSCNGHGSTEKYVGQRDEAEKWERIEPPTGEGWQVWESVSEGSPISPVFPDSEGLIQWLMSPAYTWGTSRPLTRAQAEAFVGEGHSIGSFVIAGGQFIQGDAAVHELRGDS